MSPITIPVKIDEDELWSSVMGSGFTMWSWWSKVEFLDGSDWDKPGKVVIGIDDPDTPESDPSQISKTLTVIDLANAVGQVISEGYNLSHVWDSWDAGEGDLVMQMAMLGKVAYA